MSELIRVSIITIVYNGATTIERTIRSVINQNIDNLEYIIIDGGSTDATLEVIEQYESYIDIIVSERDRGISHAFNKGIKIASGEIIGLVNADDWLEPNAVLNVLQWFPDFDLVYGKIYYWKDGSIINVKGGNHNTLGNGLRGMTIPHPSLFVRKLVYEELGGYDESYKNAMDYEFVLRAFIRDYRFKDCENILSNFNSGGVTSSHRLNSLKEEKRAKCELLEMKPLVAESQFWIKRIILALFGELIHRLNLNRLK